MFSLRDATFCSSTYNPTCTYSSVRHNCVHVPYKLKIWKIKAYIMYIYCILPASTSRRRIRTEGRTKSIVPLTYYQLFTVVIIVYFTWCDIGSYNRAIFEKTVQMSSFLGISWSLIWCATVASLLTLQLHNTSFLKFCSFMPLVS